MPDDESNRAHTTEHTNTVVVNQSRRHVLCVRGAHSSETIHCNCFPFSKKACESPLNQVQKKPLLTNDQADHHFGVLTWHDLSFQWQVLSKSGKEEMAPNCEIGMCKQKCASNGSALDKTRTNVHANTQRYTHKHTPQSTPKHARRHHRPYV